MTMVSAHALTDDLVDAVLLKYLVSYNTMSPRLSYPKSCHYLRVNYVRGNVLYYNFVLTVSP